MNAAVLIGSLFLAHAGPCDTLPPSLRIAIEQLRPAATLIRPGAADSLWRGYVDSVNESDGHPFCVTGDFDGNGQLDYALMLRDTAGIRFVAFHRNGDAYRPFPMWIEEGKERRLGRNDQSGFALYRLAPGVRDDMFDAEPRLDDPHPAIEVIHFESSSWIMAWDGHGYRTFWTSD